jgi:quinoprotein dehydrogenase-associated probable ABC transporter substrate-binding protein
MSSASISCLAAAVLLGAALNARAAIDHRPSQAQNQVSVDVGSIRPTLRVCADPNDMPFSNVRGEGFENRLAELIARDLGWKVAYTWMPQRRGFLRNTLGADRCDVVMGIPTALDTMRTTAAYYRSSFVFVTRRDRHLQLTSLDDPQLGSLRIGVHAVGGNYASVPPAQALAARGLVKNIVGYNVYGDYSHADPSRELIDAVARRDIDVAIAWGPLAGYFAGREAAALQITVPANAAAEMPPMTFDISLGVRRGDADLKSLLDGVLQRRHGDIVALLRAYGVPLVEDRDPRQRSETASLEAFP